MSDVALEYLELLAREHAALVRADVAVLDGLQSEKQSLLCLLHGAEIPPRTHALLLSRTRTNLRLMRVLVRCLQALATVEDESGYTASGSVTAKPDSHVRVSA